jgi:carboxylesterase
MRENEYKSEPFFLEGANRIGVLLLHGWSSPPDEFLPLATYLNALGYTVSAPLLRGHGTRPEDLECVRWKDWLEDARKDLRVLEKKYQKIFIVGISMGGDLAMHLSEEKSVAGVVSLGAAAKYKLHSAAKIGLFFMGLTRKYRKKYFPPWLRDKVGNRKEYMYYPVESAKEVVRLADATRKILPRITKPILIMQSDYDHLVSNKSPQIIADRVGSNIKEIVWVKDGYHVFVDKKEVWEKISEFIEKI